MISLKFLGTISVLEKEMLNKPSPLGSDSLASITGGCVKSEYIEKENSSASAADLASFL